MGLSDYIFLSVIPFYLLNSKWSVSKHHGYGDISPIVLVNDVGGMLGERLEVERMQYGLWNQMDVTRLTKGLNYNF